MTVSDTTKDDAVGKKNGISDLLVKSMLVLGTLIVCLAILEIGLRATGRFQSGWITGYEAPRGVSYGLKENVSRRISWPSFSFYVYTDNLGFRSTRPGPRSLGEKPYDAVLGASEVFGNGLDYEQTFVGVFGEKMQQGGVEVLNMAVPGHHLLEQISIFEEYAASAEHQPGVVLICLNPLLIGGYDDIHKEATVKMGYLVEKDRWRIALAKVILSSQSAIYCFFRDSIRNIQSKYFTRNDLDLSFYLSRYSTHHPIRERERTEDFLKHLTKLEDHIRKLGATPVCVYIPTVGGFLLNHLKAKGQLTGEEFDTSFFPELIRQHCQSEDIRFIDVEPLLQSMYDKGEKLNFDGDAHFNGPTSRVIGEYLYESLKPAARTAVK